MTAGKRKNSQGLGEGFGGKTLWLEFDGFTLFPSKDKKKLLASSSLNCSCADGVLRGGIGYERLLDKDGNAVKAAILGHVRGAFVLESWQKDEGAEKYYLLLDGDGKLYAYSKVYGAYVCKGEFATNGKVGVVAATACDGETKLLVSGKGGSFVVSADEWVALPQGSADKGCGALCFYKNRVFLGERPCKILYSDPETPWDFSPTYDEGGYVLLPMDKGEMVGAVGFGDCVYFFFERGVVSLNPDGLARNFKLTDVAYSGGEIFAGSMGVCGNYLFFLSENGICRFDGKEVVTVGGFLGVCPERGGQVCDHATVGDYFVVRYQEKESRAMRTAVLRADGGDGYFISDYAGLNECDRQPLCVVGAYFCTLTQGGDLPADEKREFVSELVDFGDILAGYSEGFDWRGGYMGKAKKLKTLTLYGEGCLQVEVHDGKEWHAWEIEDLPQKLTLNIGLRGEAFRFRFVLEKDAKVRGMALQAEALE